MNIYEAKQEIINTVKAYHLRDEAGKYRLEPMRQRPILLMGPPGIGKTQIMEEIAKEMGIGLLSYTITHHTRQSAVGLPVIRQEVFGGRTVDVTAYTMSEILADVHRKIREEGQEEGILFLDEINCVSETLHPAMLQFLQYKTFGNERLPEGWIIVAAGNPPEVNKSAREFDIVTLDRVREIRIEPSLETFQVYAETAGIHGAVRAYLELKPDRFYRIAEDVDETVFVTARGWEDLSRLLFSYEELEVPVGAETVREFLHDDSTAEDFASFLALFKAYGEDYSLTDILKGKAAPSVYEKAMKAGFDERLSLTILLFDSFRRKPEEESLNAVFQFLTDAFGEGKELLYFVTCLTRNADTAIFLAEHDSELYRKYSDLFLMGGRRRDLLKELG